MKNYIFLFIFTYLSPQQQKQEESIQYTLACFLFLHIDLNIFPFYERPDKITLTISLMRGTDSDSTRRGNISYIQTHSGLKLIPLALKDKATNYT